MLLKSSMTTTPTTFAPPVGPPRRRAFLARCFRIATTLWVVAFTLFVSACARPDSGLQPVWLPDSTGWVLRDFDDTDPAQWLLYERAARQANVKEFRIVGVVDAEPEAVARALRVRLLDEQYVPKGLHRRILKESESEVVLYGRTSLPFPFRDREATERYRFMHDPDTRVFRVDARAIDPGGTPPRGVVRVPVIQNSWVLAPSGSGQSVFTTDTVHDIGGAFPNALIYGAICDQLVEDLHTISALATSTAGDP